MLVYGSKKKQKASGSSFISCLAFLLHSLFLSPPISSQLNFHSDVESKKMLSVAGVAPLSLPYQYSLNNGLCFFDFLWGLNLPAKLQGKCNPIALGKQLQYK